MSPDTRTYRGSSLEEILPRIREELGPDAVITRQRDGLAGGVGGFFQKQFVEVEAQSGGRFRRSNAEKPGGPATPRSGSLVDTYDDAAIDEGMQAPAIQELMRQASPFAEQLEAAEAEQPEAPPPPAAAPGEALAVPRPDSAAEIEKALAASGLAPALATALVDSTVAHILPFASERELKRLVRSALARRIPTQPGWGGVGRTLAFVGTGGSGKTACVARLAAAYKRSGRVPVVCIALRPADGGAELRALLADCGVPVHVAQTAAEVRARIDGAREQVVAVIDTPSVSPHDTAAIDRLADELEEVNAYEIHLTLPASTGAAAARELLGELKELGVSRIALTHVDATRHLGAVVGLSISSGRPISYISSGVGLQGELDPADSQVLATMILP